MNGHSVTFYIMRRNAVFWDVTPCIAVVHRHFGVNDCHLLLSACIFIGFLGLYSVLKFGAVGSSEFVNLYRFARRRVTINYLEL
jgi:hypothetical protein